MRSALIGRLLDCAAPGLSWRGTLLGLWLLSATGGDAAARAVPSEAPEASKSTAVKSPGPAKTPRSAQPPATKAATRGARKDLGTLDEINIEGEVAVPRVLFITSRDRERFHEPLHRRYLKSSAVLDREFLFPIPRGARPCP